MDLTATAERVDLGTERCAPDGLPPRIQRPIRRNAHTDARLVSLLRHVERHPPQTSASWPTTCRPHSALSARTLQPLVFFTFGGSVFR